MKKLLLIFSLTLGLLFTASSFAKLYPIVVPPSECVKHHRPDQPDHPNCNTDYHPVCLWPYKPLGYATWACCKRSVSEKNFDFFSCYLV
jgi:hypothetical protein